MDPVSENSGSGVTERESRVGRWKREPGAGVKSDWETIKQHRARIRALLKAICNSLPDQKIPTAKMLNRRVRKLVALIETLDEFERECGRIDWTRHNELVEIYCTGESIKDWCK